MSTIQTLRSYLVRESLKLELAENVSVHMAASLCVFLLCADSGRQKFWGMLDTSGNDDVYGPFNNTSSRLAAREQTKAVLLLTYMRTGSSLTGEILQQLPGAFYVFEPLRTLYETNRLPGKYKVADVHVETLRGWLTCDFSRIYLKSFDDFTFLALGKQTKHLNECRRRRPVGMAPKDVFLQCVEDLRQRCLNSSVRVVKTIRTPMSMALKLSKVVDNLKNSLLDVKYEDIASRPLTTVRRMFSFLGRTLPVAVAEFAVAVTVGGNRSECEVCRQNSIS
ncbi:hypothetical protein MAR_037193 [Mya arenaria]|uniref:Sulfotransferase n=1 Tax=Mya arenaria TaxID=6604 RepID=A0ABY7FRP2_MYAAR|nr:hypothetical protein MAR_037193 [Mya arenaria]